MWGWTEVCAYGTAVWAAALLGSDGGARAWGICTECGMGRVDAGDVPGLLDLHSQILSYTPV